MSTPAVSSPGTAPGTTADPEWDIPTPASAAPAADQTPETPPSDPDSGLPTAEGAEAETPEQPQEGETPQPPAQEASAPFTFAGKQYASLKEAENAHQSALGRQRAAEERARQAISVAQQWMRLANERAQPAPAPDTAQPETQAEPEKEYFESKEFWDVFQRIQDTDGLPAALYYLLSESKKSSDARLERAREEWLQPHEQNLQAQRTLQTANRNFDIVAQATNPAGDPLYPELQSEDLQVQKDIVECWKQIGDPRIQLSPYGWELAVARYRVVQQLRGASASAAEAPGSGSGVSKGVVANLATAARTASTTVGGGNGTPRAAAKPASPSEIAREKIRRAAVSVVDEHGFDLGPP